MQQLKNFKHIFFIVIISLLLIFVAFLVFGRNFAPINQMFIYRTGKQALSVKDGKGIILQDSYISWDWIYRHKNLQASDDIIMVAIDDATIDFFQNEGKGDQQMLTIPKYVYKDLIERIEKDKPKAIGFDIVFQNIDAEEEDFVRTLGNYDNIVIGTLVPFGQNTIKQWCVDKNNVPIKPPESVQDTESIKKYTERIVSCPSTPRTLYRHIPWGLLDIGTNLEQRAGMLNLADDNRFLWKSVSSQGLKIPAFPLVMAQLGQKESFDTRLLQKKTFVNSFFMRNDTSSATIDDISAASAYSKISMKDALPYLGTDPVTGKKIVNPRANVEIFKDKYVLIGESGTALHDRVLSPVHGAWMDGMEVHAHFLDAILQNKLLHRVDVGIMFFVFIILTIVAVIVYFFIPKFLSPIFAIVMLFVVIWVSRYLYDAHRLLIDIFPLFLSVTVITYPVTYIYRYFIIEREKRYIMQAFSRYLSPSVVKMIDANTINSGLGGENRELSVFFSDIANFTTITEKAPVHDLFYMLVLYLSRMTDVLVEQHGTLDKYIGDAVMGFFGAPVHDPHHAVHACNAAVLMRQALHGVNQEIGNLGIGPIDFRVGIATGRVMVGNIGSEERFNYTVLGDTVNLAARLESAGKEYGVHMIIAASTYQQIGNAFFVRELDNIAVKGKTEAIRIFELIDFAGKVQDTSVYDAYAQALQLYREGKYMEAGQIWEKYMNVDAPSRVMAYRCVDLLQGKTHINGGVYHMTHK